MGRLWRSSGHALALVALVACGAPSPAGPARVLARAPAPAPPSIAVDTGDLDAYFRAQFPADHPGVAVLIAKRGRTVFAAGYGLADLGTRAPITTRTLFNLGSLSKTFVASAILLLAERGQLSLDDPLTKYFTFAHPDVVRNVQLRHLLTHTSGLPDLRPVEEQLEFYLTARDAENWAPILAVEALASAPGTRFAYSNPAFNGLALIVEQVSGRKWQDFVRDEVFLPSGMATSTITDGPHPRPASPTPHARPRRPDRAAGGVRLRRARPSPPPATAGSGSSVEELARYEQALTTGAALPTAVVADAPTLKTFPGWLDEAPPRLGWSWWIKDVDGLQEIGHTGSQGGFSTNYVVVPAKDVLIVFLMNGDSYDAWKATNAELHRWLAAHAWLDAP
ncbi:MAG: beta-lactamase family protein [Myxococcales bacterium]|nr:beta-lactamase family protein [Myxococcales bacterium]